LRGIRNPTEALASLRDWVDGDIAQRLTGQAVLRYSGQDIGMTLIGVRPKQELLVSNIGEDIRKGDFEDLGTTSNGLVLGDKAAERLGADLGDTVTLTSANGVAKRFKIVGLFHTGITTSDESRAYATHVAVAIAARAERQLGYKAISWEEANEGLMEAFFVRNVIMFTAVGGILLVAGFGIYNIISTIVHEKARDIAILKSLGFPEPDIQQIFVMEDLRGIRNPTEALASLRDWVDGDIAQRLTGQAVLRYSGQDIGMTLIGVRPKQELLVSNIGEDIRKGDFEDLGTTSNGLVLGDKAAERLGADLGDTVTLTSANGVAKRFKIVGLFHTGITTSDESRAYATHVAVAIAARAERQLGYKAISWEEANEGLMEAFFVRNVIMFTAVGGILLVAGFGIYNIISTIVHEKARDIAILKSLGFPEPDIQQIFVMEGLVIGVLGAL
ncbi:Lipoprotein-releasing system transmembrane protein LolC, partial [Durusdinium trenchii]